MFNKLPKRSGLYRIRDNIEELKLEIQFRHVNSLLQLPNYEITEKGFTFNAKATNNAEAEQNVTIQQIKWQQKLLSPHEVELYRELHNCVTDRQKLYNQWLLQASEKGSAKRKLKKRSKKSARITQMGSEIFTYVQADNFVPAEEKDATQHLNVETMYIYAALSPDTQLVALKWHAEERLLHVYPDFNDMQVDPYFVELNIDYRHIYAYACANISVSRLQPLAIYAHIPDLFDHAVLKSTHWQTEAGLNNLFQMPPKRMQRFALLFEIRSACCLAYQPMHIRFHVQLPEHCLLEEGALEAATHACFAADKSTCPAETTTFMRSFQFGYNFQLTLLCEEAFQETDLVHIYFELISIDSWERERVEGYAHYSSYLQPGRDEQSLSSLRPKDSFLDALRCFFIGGRRKFNYVYFFTPPKTEQTVLHSRYQCSMTDTGHVHVVCQRLLQRNCELLSPCKSRCSGMTLDDILLAYVQARKRLEGFVLK